MLIHIEKIVHNYLMKELCQNKEFENDFQVFAVEGGTAAMCYIFDSLVVNNLLKSGDTIALSRDCKDNLISVVKEHNPELMIVTDDVY